MLSTISQRLVFEGLTQLMEQGKQMGQTFETSTRQIGAAVQGIAGQIAALEKSVQQIAATANALKNSGAAAQQAVPHLRALGQAANDNALSFNNAGRDLALLARGMGLMNSQAVEVSQSILKLTGEFAGIAGAIAIAVTALGYLAVRAAEANQAITNHAAALGLTRSAYEELRFAAVQTGVSVETFDRGMARFTANVGKAAEAQEDLAKKSGLVAEEQKIAAEKTSIALDEANLALDKNADHQWALRTAIDAATVAVLKAKDAVTNHVNSVEQASLSAQKAKLQYEHLRDTFSTVGKSANEIAQAQIGLRESFLHVGDAARAVTEAEHKRAEEMAAVKIAQDKLLASQKAFAEEQKQRQIDFKKEQLALDEQKLGLDKVTQSAELAKNVFQKLGITVQTGEGAMEANLNAFKKAMEGIPDVATRNALSLQAFGRSWIELAPFINLTTEGLAKFREESKRVVVEATGQELEAASRFLVAYRNLHTAMEGIQTAIGSIVGDIFVPIFRDLTDYITDNRQAIRDWWSEFTRDAIPNVEAGLKIINLAFHTLTAAIREIGWAVNAIFGTDFSNTTAGFIAILARFSPVLAGLILLFDNLKQIINSVFGTEFTTTQAVAIAVMLRFSGVIGLVTGAFTGLKVAIALISLESLLGGIGAVTTAMGWLSAAAAPLLLWPAIIAAIVVALGLIFLPLEDISKFIRYVFGDAAADALDTFGKNFSKAADDWVATFKGTVQGLVDIWDAGWNLMWEKVTNFAATFKGVLDGLGEIIAGLWGKLTDLQAKASAPGPNGLPVGFVQQAAAGTILTGPGTGTSDSIPIWASVGEAITKARAVAYYGVDMMRSINNMTFPKFAMGGIVDGLSPAAVSAATSSTGAPTGGGTPIHLTIDGQTFRGLTAPPNVARSLLEHAQISDIISLGPKPSWKR